MLGESFRVTAGLRATVKLDKEARYGIELEYEQATLLPTGLTYWTTARDNSLRDGIELISKPLLWKSVDKALDEAEKAVKACKYVATPRCGLHVHVNMRHKTLAQVFNFLTLYSLVEPTIFRTYALGREDSNFCVPMYSNQLQISALMKDNAYARRKQARGWRSMTNIMRSSKYSAVNINTLGSFGTVEMRQAYCTTDFTAIRRWITFLDYLSRRSEDYDDPVNIVEEYSKKTTTRLQVDFFGQGYRIDPRIQQMAVDNAALIAGYPVTNWKTLNWPTPTGAT